MTRELPRDPLPDSTFAFAVRGYLFISERCRRYQSDLFQTQRLFQKTICMLGDEAATLFYDNERFERKEAPRDGYRQRSWVGAKELEEGLPESWHRALNRENAHRARVA